jgi:chemotaxis protein MotB
MFKNDTRDSDSNFWISYADLMAGMLFVFILLIGAIVSKSTILKTQLHEKEDSLEKSLALVDEKDSTLLKKDKELQEKDVFILEKNKLISEKDKKLAQTNEALAKEKKHLSEVEKALQEKNAREARDKLLLAENERLLKLKLEEIKELNKKLLLANTKADNLSGKIVIVQAMLDENNKTLAKTKSSLKNKEKSLKDYENKVVVLSNQLSDSKESVKLKDEKLLKLLNVMDEKKTKYDELVANLQAQKAKIKSLTGIKLQVIAALKETLGSKINIDKKTGSLRLASNILFGVGESTLKDEAKVELKKAFEEYIGTLVTNDAITPHLDKIIIEGHTDSDGGYMYNLALSQKRALAVMEYFLTLEFSKKHNIKPLMIASGRAYLDAIKRNGVEDKEASRRIEIKFRLKNEDAMQEIEKVLDAE